MLNFLGYKFIEFLAFIIPYPVCYFFAGILARIVCGLSFFVKILKKNVSFALAKNANDIAVKKIVRKIYIHWFLNIVDFLKHPFVRGDNFKKRIELTGIENIDSSLKKGKGIVIFTAHLGNFEWGACRVAVEGYPIWGTGLTRKSRRTMLFFENRRLSKGLKTLYVNKVMTGIFRILKNNEIIAIPTDFDPLGTARLYKFFGKEAYVPSGPVEIALKSGAVLIPSFIWRKDKYSHRQIIGEPVELLPIKAVDDRDKKMEIIDENMQKMISIMEKYIIEHIEQWELFHDIWQK